MKPGPVVVLAAPHSEAARVAAMLGGHRQALALPDLHLFHGDTVGQLLDLFAHSQANIGDGLLRAVALLFAGTQGDEGIAAARRYLRRRSDWSTAALLDALITAIAPRAAVFHDTAAPLRVTELDRWFAAAPDAAYLHVVRHPERFEATARDAYGQHLYIPPDVCDHADGKPVLDPQLMWYRVQQTLMNECDPDRHRLYRLRAEDLMADVRLCSTRLCRWLGWSAEEHDIRAMQHPERGPFARRGPDSAPRGLCEGFLRNPTFAPALGERSERGTLVDSALAPEIKATARQLGYT